MSYRSMVKFAAWLVVAGGCIAALRYWPESWSDVESWHWQSVARWTDLSAHVEGPGLSFENDGKTLKLTAAGPATLIWEVASPGSLREVEIHGSPDPTSFERGDLRLFYNWRGTTLNYLEHDSFVQARVAPRDDFYKDGRWVHRWILPAEADRLALQVHGPVEWPIDRIALKMLTNSAKEDRHPWLPWVPCAFASGLCLAGLNLLRTIWPAWSWQQHLKRAWLAGIGATAVMIAILVPPFQGPDENRHWQAALKMYRARAEQETALYQLPNTLQALPPRWKGDVPFDAGLLRTTSPMTVHRQREVQVGYANPLTYPIVGLVSLFFPHVTNHGQALLFYYTCRLLPILFLMGLLVWAERQGWLSYTLLLVLSFPLFLQQIVVVTSDTLTNWGSLATFFLFIAVRRHPTLRTHLLLWGVAWVTTLAKPPTLLPLLPFVALPWSKIPYKPFLALAACLLLPAAGWWVMHRGLEKIAASDPQAAEKLWKQLEFVGSAKGQGVFLRSVWWRFTYSEQVIDEGYQPLGWLDTLLNHRYRMLIYLSFWIALLADGCERGPGILRDFRAKWLAWLGLLLLACIHAILLILAICMIMYLTNSDVGQLGIVGVQMRYFFPALLGFLLIPLAARPVAGSEESGSTHCYGLTHGLGLLLLLLFLFRGIELAGDLLFRYWR